MLFKKYFALFILLVLTTACVNIDNLKMTPLYSQSTINEINSVYIASIDGQNGVYLHNVLQVGINTDNNPKYRLQADLDYTEKNLAIGNDSSIIRKQINVNVNFVLVDITGSEEVITSFSTIGFANYSSSTTSYLTEVSKQDAIRRALSIAGQSAILRLGHIFENGILKK